MSQNNMNQKRFLLNKLGLGKPQATTESASNNGNSKPAQQPAPPTTQKPTPKPGCGACSRRKKQQ